MVMPCLGESLKRGIFKSGNLLNEESLKAGIFKTGILEKREHLKWGIFRSVKWNRLNEWVVCGEVAIFFNFRPTNHQLQCLQPRPKSSCVMQCQPFLGIWKWSLCQRVKCNPGKLNPDLIYLITCCWRKHVNKVDKIWPIRLDRNGWNSPLCTQTNTTCFLSPYIKLFCPQ